MIDAVVSALLWALAAGALVALAVTAGVALIIAATKPLAATRHALWLVALLVTALAPVAILGTMAVRGTLANAPPPASSAFAAATAEEAIAAAELANEIQAARAAAEPGHFALPDPPQLPKHLSSVLLAVWAAVALIGLVGLGRSILRVRGLKRRSSALEGALADELPWLTESRGREIYLRLSYEIETPIAVGFRRPVILLPTEMTNAGGLRALESLVMHEHAHLAHYDDWTNLLQRALERILWFHPIVWIIGRRLALEREVAADEAVVARTNDARNYATTLWRLAREMRMPEHVVVAPGALLSRKQISVRIERLVNETPGDPKLAGVGFGVAVVAMTAIAAVAATAPPLALPPTALALSNSHMSAQQPMHSHAHMPRSSFTRQSIQRCAENCDYSMQNLRGLDLSGLSLAGFDFNGADLTGANLAQTSISGTDFHQADLRGVNLAGARISGSDLRGAKLSGANLAGVRATGVDLRQSVVLGAPEIRSLIDTCRGCDLRGLDLHGLDLHGVSLIGDDLSDTNLRNANLHGAKLTNVTLRRANLDGADLGAALIIGSTFDQASVTGTNTDDAAIIGSQLP